MKLHVVTVAKMCYQLTEVEKRLWEMSLIFNLFLDCRKQKSDRAVEEKQIFMSFPFSVFSASGRVFCCLVFCLVYVSR